MNLSILARRYADEHPRLLSPSYVDQLRWVVSSYRTFLGRDPTVEDLTREGVNGYLAWLAASHRSPWTCRTRRTVLLVLARHAAADGLLPGVPQPKRVQAPSLAPQTWTPEEIRRLVAEARLLPGAFPVTKIPRAPYIAGLIVALYDSGLRVGDAMRLGRRQIAGDGSFTAICSKTGRQVVRHLSPAAMDQIDASGAAGRSLIWPLWGRRDQLFRLVRRLVAKAGIPCGSLQWLRRAGVTAICRDCGLDAGRRFADHRSAATTLAHYVDQRQLGDVPQPPPLY